MSLWRMLARVSLPRMREHRLRSVLTTLGIALGVAVLVAVVLVSRSIVLGVTQTIADLAGKADLQVAASASGLSESMIDKIREVPGVYKLTPVMQQIVTLQTAHGQRERLLVLGVDLLGSEDAFFRDYASKDLDAIRSDSLAFLNSSTNIILSRQLAERCGLHVHDKVSIGSGNGLQEFEVWGLIESRGVGRAFGGAVGVMYYPAMQVAFERGRNIDRIDVAVTPDHDPEPVVRALQRALGPGVNIERPALRGERVSKMLVSMRTALTMSSLIALLAGAFLVFNTMSISIAQRKRELGILRALGTTRRQLIALLTLEGALFGVVGSALGVAIGIGLSSGMLRLTSRAVNQVYMQQAVNEVQVDVPLCLFGFVLGVASASLAALIATQRAASMRPVDALSSGTLQPAAGTAQRLGRTDLIGFILLLLSALLVSLPAVGHMPFGPLAACITLTLGGRALMPRFVKWTQLGLNLLPRRMLGIEATLARGNLPRDLSRTASTASGLMAGVALTVSSASFIVSFVTSLENWSAQVATGDLFVTSGAAVSGLSSRNTPMSDALRPELLAIPGVERVRRLRFIDLDFRGAPVQLSSTDMREFVKRSHLFPVEGSEQQIVRALLAGKAAVSENFSHLYDVHRGDHIELSAGDGAHVFEVGGVIEDYTSDRGAILIDRASYTSAWHDERVDTYEVHLRRGSDAEAVRRLIDRRLGESHDLFVLTNREFRGEFVKAIDQIFGLMHVLEVVTLLVALLGMVSALLANVLDRVRELGVLRALGMLRAQVQRLVIIESTFVGLIGTLAGVAMGIALGYILLRHIATVQIGWYLPYRLPASAIAQLCLVTIPLAALAGFYPARKAAQLVVSDALDYE
jgi:putative ABC transport system permease protein